MPAITVADVTTLARIPELGPQAVQRPVLSVTTAPSACEGEGFPVRRAFAEPRYQDLRAAESTLLTTPGGGALVRVIAGSVGAEHRPVHTGQLTVFGPGDAVTIAGAVNQQSRYAGLDVVVLGGAPIREPIAWGGPFVMNTRAEVLAAFEDYQAGRLGTIPAQQLPHTDVTGGAGVRQARCGLSAFSHLTRGCW